MSPLEILEQRRLFSTVLAAAIPSLRVTPALADVAAPAKLTAAPNASVVTNNKPTGYSPSQIATAYRTYQIDVGHARATGAGQTIANVDAYNDADLTSDLASFDKHFSLPAASLTILSQTGSTTDLPTADAGWARETALDVEWAHATAPGAKLLLVEANSDSLSDLMIATDEARQAANVSVVSMSWGTGEFYGENELDDDLLTPTGHSNEVFVAASGDDYAEQWPSSSPNVLSVGGTRLYTQSASGVFHFEKPWIASGGGYSAFEAEPDYQFSVQYSGDRTTPDVSFDASPSSGVAVYDSVPYEGTRGWVDLGGTSAGAPQWAGLVALADQGRATHHADPLNTESVLSTIYNAVDTPVADNADFHDVWGNPTGPQSSIYVAPRFAAYGYDLYTGFGSPRGAATDNLLVNATLQAASASDFVPVSAVTTAPQTPATDTRPAPPPTLDAPAVNPPITTPERLPEPPPTEVDLGDIFGRSTAAAFTTATDPTIYTAAVAAPAVFSDAATGVAAALHPDLTAPASTAPAASTAVPTQPWAHAFSAMHSPLGSAFAPLLDAGSLLRTADEAVISGTAALPTPSHAAPGWSTAAIVTTAAVAVVWWVESERERRTHSSPAAANI